jgi:predicted TPR repeat methyltransferase
LPIFAGRAEVFASSFADVIDYDAEAERYALAQLLGSHTRTVLDVGCGTGLVGRRLAEPEYRVYGVDRSAGMAVAARHGLPHPDETTFTGVGDSVYQLFGFTLRV